MVVDEIDDGDAAFVDIRVSVVAVVSAVDFISSDVVVVTVVATIL